MRALTQEQFDDFWRDGAIVVENAVTRELLLALNDQFDGWVMESRTHEANYGEMIDGRPRFDLQLPGHNRANPVLRRVNSPTEVSPAYLAAASESRIPDMVADLVGPNVKFHHSKINAKHPGSGTAVKWHQDFPFTPHSNTDLVTALLAMDDVGLENGPLIVGTATHLGPLASIWQGDTFTGIADDEAARAWEARARTLVMPAGSVCLMHTCVGHSSAANVGTRPRRLFIVVYSAEDAMPLSPNPLPSLHEGMLVRGDRTGRVRSTAFDLKLPERPRSGSFFNQQAGYDG
jgi:ectoine hydroxylase-related dioxygenase (phytanoyl-CoA dioxygenase family)